MNKTPVGFETRLLSGTSLDAADDAVIAVTPPAPGRDPREIRRTQVRGLRWHLPREGKDATH